MKEFRVSKLNEQGILIVKTIEENSVSLYQSAGWDLVENEKVEKPIKHFIEKDLQEDKKQK